MPNGSLESWLHPDTNGQMEQQFLNLLERVSILLDVAFALDYLHCHGPAPVIHCDLKSSNVLLDADMVAHVGDFGLAKILYENSTVFHQSMSSVGVKRHNWLCCPRLVFTFILLYLLAPCPFFFLPSPLSDKLNFAATEASRGVATFSPIICYLALKVCTVQLS